MRSFENRFKKFIAFFLNITGIYYLADKVLSLLFRDKGVYVFMYHRIACKDDGFYEHNLAVKKENFIKQLEFFKKRFDFVSMTQAIELLKSKNTLRKDAVVFTFDDGYRDNLAAGLDLFREYEIHPLIYLTAGVIDRNGTLWTETIDRCMTDANCRGKLMDYFCLPYAGTDLPIKEVYEMSERIKKKLRLLPLKKIQQHLDDLVECLPQEPDTMEHGLMTWNEASILLKAGCDLGSHTMNHVNLASEDKISCEKEILEAQVLIRNRTGSPSEHFAYPYGKKEHFTGDVAEIVKNHYQSAVTAIEGINYPCCDLYTLRRIGISNDKDIYELKMRLLLIKMRAFYRLREIKRGKR